MLKSLANSKFFFLALGVVIALCGVKLSAAPSDTKVDTEYEIRRIADAVERIQRDGLKVKASNEFADEFKVKVVK